MTPINPKISNLRLGKEVFPSVAPNISALPSPTETALSIITPPRVTMSLLREAKDAGIPAVWMQPGSFDDEGLEFAKSQFQVAIGGFEGKSKDSEGWCVLVDGEKGLSLAGRKWERYRL